MIDFKRVMFFIDLSIQFFFVLKRLANALKTKILFYDKNYFKKIIKNEVFFTQQKRV
jgi:hypothetical protein